MKEEGREGKELSFTQIIMYAIQLDSKFTKCIDKLQ